MYTNVYYVNIYCMTSSLWIEPKRQWIPMYTTYFWFDPSINQRYSQGNGPCSVKLHKCPKSFYRWVQVKDSYQRAKLPIIRSSETTRTPPTRWPILLTWPSNGWPQFVQLLGLKIKMFKLGHPSGGWPHLFFLFRAQNIIALKTLILVQLFMLYM